MFEVPFEFELKLPMVIYDYLTLLYSIHLFSYQKIFIFYHKDYSIHIVA